MKQSSEFETTGRQFGFTFEPGEQYTRDFWRAVAAEGFGMIFFLFFTLGTVAASSGYSAANGLGFDSARHWMISSVFGFMISILVYAIAPVSGGNLNPAVSVALMVTEKISPLRCGAYVAAQCAGASVGCALVRGVSEARYAAIGGAVNAVQPGFGVGGAFLAEMMGTMLLVFVVCSVVDVNNGHPERVNMKQSQGVVSVGLCVTMAHCVLIPITNCSINPARSFGASLVQGKFPDHWIFWVAPLTASVITSAFYEFVIKDPKGMVTVSLGPAKPDVKLN